jgi:5-methylcytosine-specific restriction endonuclease McrA
MTIKKKAKPFWKNLTDAEFKSRIISALRQASRWWVHKSEAIARARVWRWKYKCESCWEIWPLSLPPEEGKKRKRKNIQADHKEPIVPVTGFTTYDDWIKRCFVWAEGFDALCWECHSIKTKKENTERRAIKKASKEAKKV